MTKKDYKLVAESLKYSDEQGWTDHIELMAEDMADVFEAHNPKFNRSKFLKACGLEV